MRLFDCPTLGAAVELTDEREEHVLARHPELVDHLDEIAAAVREPDEVLPSPCDVKRLFIRWSDRIRSGRFVIVAVVTLDRHCVPDEATASRSAMNLTLKYDPPSDTLYIDVCPPYAEQDSDEILPGVVARSNPANGRIETLEVMYFRERFAGGKPFELPVTLEMQPAS